MQKNKNPLELTPELKSLVKSVVMAKAWVETVHPIVIGYQKAILQEITAVDEEGKPIIDPNLSYLMDDGKAEVYFAKCEEEAAKNNLKHKPECCPLLEAESVERKAKRMLGEYVLPRLPGFEKMTFDTLVRFAKNDDDSIKRDKLGRMMFKSDEMIDLILSFLVPQMTDELEDLQKSFEP